MKERSSELLHIDSFHVILDSNSILELLKEPYLQTILPIHFNEKNERKLIFQKFSLL
ncbi:hypothetical protein RBB68_04025 [Leptospira interrogans]|uniref:Uncharacterized protein n=11 Tax=Leptospira interrogans TaxID=173 RepID=A0A0E2DF43_LEPIR|nr:MULTISPECIES: hypothetical protein [Leptospira]AKH78087.1 hypothetical protein BRAT_14215 [Leptospira interrogans serovar Bratislava]ALE40735.1 hypothetical protein G436_3586 [Leptospira interrogans serovar Hardjo str. Norma]ALO01550.1 hypothetical protein LIH_14440 [Leptospira interrogans serovar Hardjo-prajitno]EJP05870.1 hypothetical protein LEP1GSC007_3430 [Leptospira interrogans serovar Bulgarica str. Mallika]EJP17178.1 hypothetical protein LEP1GSC080_3285 [Leptospira interrogans str. 